MSHNWRTGRAVGAGGGAVVAEPVRARAGLADGAGHEAGLLATRRARRAARDLTLAVHVQVPVAHSIPGVMGDAAHVLAVVAGAGALAVDGRAHRVDARIAAAGARRGREQADGSGQREREDELLSTHGHLLRGFARTAGSWTLQASAGVGQPKKITSSRTKITASGDEGTPGATSRGAASRAARRAHPSPPPPGRSLASTRSARACWRGRRPSSRPRRAACRAAARRASSGIPWPPSGAR